MPEDRTKRIVIAGAGAAGLTAAYFAALEGAEVILLERNDRAGNKIVMSGGSRCNLLPVVVEEKDFVTGGSQRSLANVFKSWSLDACRQWFEHEIGLPLQKEDASNKWFPASQSGREVRDVLVRRVEKAGAKICYNESLEDFSREDDGFMIQTSKKSYQADALIIATGGFSVPASGTDGSGHRVLKAKQVTTEPVYPALTPLKGAHPGGEKLQGISLEVQSDVEEKQKVLATAARAGFLFTHRGYSGPAVLDLSHYFSGGEKGDFRLFVNWDGTPESIWLQRLSPTKTLVENQIAKFLPARLANALASETGTRGIKLSELSKELKKKLIEALTRYPLPVEGNEGFGKAEVTGGGVPFEEINTATMALKKHAGIYVCGEIVDVFGRIGGFNFYWAWVSGRLAGKSAAAPY